MSTSYRMTEDEIKEVVDKNTQQKSCIGWIIGFVLMLIAFFVVLGFLIYKIVKCKKTPKTIIPPITKLTTAKTTPNLLTKV